MTPSLPKEAVPRKRKYSHLLGVFKIGEKEAAIELADKQFAELLKRGTLGKEWVEIRVFLVDNQREEK